jgi:hypothetical protein
VRQLHIIGEVLLRDTTLQLPARHNRARQQVDELNVVNTVCCERSSLLVRHISQVLLRNAALRLPAQQQQ